MEVIFLAIIASWGLVFTLWKLLGMNALKYDWAIDTVFTVLFPMLLSGSFDGMVLALLTGIFLSVELFALKKMLYKEPEETKKKTIADFIKVEWEEASKK